MIRIIILVLVLLVSTVNAQQTSPGQPELGQTGTATEPEQNTTIDKLHRSTTKLFQDLVGKSDSIFMDEDYRSFGENSSRLRVRFDLGYIEHHGWDEKFKVKMRLVLPRFNERIQLIAGGDEGNNDDVTATEDGNNLALRWVGLQSEKASLAFDVGLRYKSSSFDPFLRLNSGILYGISENWYGYTFNRLYYYSNTHWRNDFRQSFNRPITENLLFRARTRVQYFDENDYNPYLEQKFSLFHTLKNKSAIAYEALWQKKDIEDSVFDEDEIKGKLEDSYQGAALRLRYRRNVWRDWMYVEVWPMIAWAEERNWDTVLGANFRLEVTFGGKGKSKLSD